MEVLHVLIVVFVLVKNLEGRNVHKKKTAPTPPAHTKPTERPPKQALSSAEVISSMMTNYIKQEPPRIDRPTEVKLGVYVNSFYSVSEQTMDYSVNMYVRQTWRDERLIYPGTFPGNKSVIRLFDNHYSGPNGVWVPDTFFRNEKKAQFHAITVENKMMRLTQDGVLWYVTKVSATLSCPMRLHKYPFDTQVCPMSFESFGYTMDVLFFAWIDSPVQIDPGVLLPQFSLKENLLYDCSQNYTAGAFPCQEIRFVLSRDIGFFIIQVFVPSILVVILSWVSFWINIDGVPARVSIGLLTVLTTTTQSSGINAQLPKVSYIKAIDIWMIMCLLFVFAALLEYAFVNVAARNGVRIRTPIVRQATLVDGGDRPLHLETSRKPPVILSSCWKAICRSDAGRFTVSVDVEGSKRRARQIDKMSRKVFPLAFLFFNILYWIACTLPTGISDFEMRT